MPERKKSCWGSWGDLNGGGDRGGTHISLCEFDDGVVLMLEVYMVGK